MRLPSRPPPPTLFNPPSSAASRRDCLPVTRLVPGGAGGLTRAHRRGAEREGSTVLGGVLPEIPAYKHALRQGWAQGTRDAVSRHAENLFCPGTSRGPPGKKWQQGKHMGYSTDEETARKSVEKTENVLKRYNLCVDAQKGGHVNTLHEAFNVERFNDALKPLAESPRLAKAASDLSGGKPMRLRSLGVYRRGSPMRFDKAHIEFLNSDRGITREDDYTPMAGSSGSVNFWCPIAKKPDPQQESAPVVFARSHEYKEYTTPLVEQYFTYLQETTMRYKNSTLETGDNESHQIKHASRYIFGKKSEMSRGGFSREGQLSEAQKDLKKRFCPDYTKPDKHMKELARKEYDPLTRYVPSNRHWSLTQVLCMPPLLDAVKYKLGPELSDKVGMAHEADGYVSDELWTHVTLPDYDVGDCLAFSGNAIVGLPKQTSNSTDTPSEFVTLAYMPDDGQVIPKNLWYGTSSIETHQFQGRSSAQYKQDYAVSYKRWYNTEGEEARLEPEGAPVMWPR